MRKITDFIINKRHFILVLFIIFTIIAAILTSKVKINYDIAEYLPDTSETRIGMNIMEEEFSETETSTLNLMFEDLTNEEKSKIKSDLEAIEGIKSVDYDNTEKYNKENYTLYVINVDDEADSQMSKDIYNEITEKYEDYTIYTSGNVSENNKSVLPFWIIALAVFCALIILIIMCESYVEPFLFLTSILMAVVLNKGTNIIFPNVSNITASIVAILQMALSMDYSIMLMNRYDQEKKIEKDNIKAMKNALYKAFTAISSSSATTIVGLLALVFMSFKIGKDLGFVLAKGVLFSLICIFFVLPALILMFDKWIVKTKKRSPNIKLNKLGKFSYNKRLISIPIFLIVFITSFMLKGNLGIDYTDSKSDEINKIFTENNQIAIIYKNDDEAKVSQYLQTFEDEEKIDEVLAYSNTINEGLTFDKLNNKLNDLGSNVEVEDYLLKIVYYDYYNRDEKNAMTFDEFINFIENEAYSNEKVNEKIDDKTKNDITRLKNFVTVSSMNKKRTANDIANILEIDKSQVDDLFIYYLSKNNSDTISLNEFINFMNKDVLTNNKYASKISSENKVKLNTLSTFTNKQTIQSKMTSNQMAKIFGIDNNTMQELYKYYTLVNNIDTKMTISEFSNFVLNNVLTNKEYSNSFDEKTIQNIKLLSTFSNLNTINKQMNSNALSNLFGVEEAKVNQILLLKYNKQNNDNKYTIAEFVENVIAIKNNSNYLDGIDLGKINTNPQILSDTTKYSSSEMSKILGMDVNPIYNLIDFMKGNIKNWTATPNEFVKLILENSKEESIKTSIDEVKLKQLQMLSNIMTYTINNKKFTYQEISQVIGIDVNNAKNIYTLYVTNKSNVTLTPKEFVDFVLIHKNDDMLKNKITSNTIKDLNLVQTVMNSVINNKKYNSAELSSLLGINKEDLNLLYGLYNFKYINKNPSLSLKDFVDFLLKDVVTNKEYSSNFDKEKTSKLNTVSNIMNSAITNTKYTVDEIFAIISTLSNDVEKNTVEMLYTYYGSNKEYNSDWQMTVEEFVNFLNDDVLQDERFIDFIDDDMKNDITEAKKDINDARQLLIGDNYSRIVLNTTFLPENEETFEFIQNTKDMLGKELDDFYIIGDSPMAYEMSQTFDNELNLITIITMVAIFIVVLCTFKSVIIPIILVLTIQTAVYLTMGILSIIGENVYFIAILIVQSILMGATIDYAILYTSYYLEHRKSEGVKESIIDSYNKSINTILTSSSILIIVTLIIANFASAIAAKICKTISEGTLCSTILILILLPAVLACCDKFITKKSKLIKK